MDKPSLVKLPKLKHGDKVVMHTCMEAEDHENFGKVWTCRTDEYTQGKGVYEQNLVFLDGFSGCFLTKYLQYIDLEGADTNETH